MALISHADWLDRFGDDADEGADVEIGSLRFELVPTASRAPVAKARPQRSSVAGRPLLAYRAGPPYRERRAEPRPSR